MLNKVKETFDDSIKILSESRDLIATQIVSAAKTMTEALLNENKILSCGNGGSASLAQHFSAQMLNRFELERPGLPAFSLTADSSTLTSIASDYQYAEIYSKQIRAIGQPDDILLAICSAVDSYNIIHAIDAAHDREMIVIALTGREGGQITDLIEKKDIEIRVPSWSTARIHESHLLVIHSICELIDKTLLGNED